MTGKRIRSAGFAILAGLFVFSGCMKTDTLDTGLLMGVISIGPLCPVEQVPPQPPCLPTAETYKAYPVGIWTADGQRLVARILPDISGDYKTVLLPGTYMVKMINQQGIGGSNLPAQIMIIPREDTVLNINIDTGIR
jgi:hypothetical protein